jgi:purine-nucleoside phosphorylase
MTPHLEAKVGDYASTVLMPGDPLRAKWIAETYLTNVKQVNSVRNCLGFTGNYRGHSVSVQASGMGQPSLSIYAHELYETYKVDNIIRVGSCGGIGNNVAIGDIVIASSASTDSNMSKLLLGNNIDINPPADWNLLESFINNIPQSTRYTVGNIISSDWFYHPDKNWFRGLDKIGILGVEMEAHMLYAIAMIKNKRALAVNTVSNHFTTGGALSSAERETSFTTMTEIALETAIES